MAEDEHPGTGTSGGEAYEAIQYARKSPLDGAQGGLVCPKHPGQRLTATGLWGVATLSKQDVGLAPVFFCPRCHVENDPRPRRGERQPSIRRG